MNKVNKIKALLQSEIDNCYLMADICTIPSLKDGYLTEGLALMTFKAKLEKEGL